MAPQHLIPLLSSIGKGGSGATLCVTTLSGLPLGSTFLLEPSWLLLPYFEEIIIWCMTLGL